MTGPPVAGWYTDPVDARRLRYWDGNAWSNQTRAVESPIGVEESRRRLPASAIVGIVVGALLAIAGFIVIMLNIGGGSSPSETPTPGLHATPDPTTGETTPTVVTLEGWEVYTSRSGAIEYAYDPAWTDIWTPENELVAIGPSPHGGFEMELAGSWMIGSSSVTGNTALVVLVMSNGLSYHGVLEVQADSFVDQSEFSPGVENIEEIYSEGFITANGYDAWRIDYTLDMSGQPTNASVIAFEDDVTLGFAFVGSPDDYDEWMPDFLAVLDSLVVVKPPVSP